MILVCANYCNFVELPTAAGWVKPVNGVSLGVAEKPRSHESFFA